MGERSHSTPLVIGVGFFADALKRLEHLVEALGDIADSAIVAVPQVDSKTYSMLTALLQPHTSLRILDVTAQTSLHTGCIYLCPVAAFVELRGTSSLVSSMKIPFVKRARSTTFFARWPKSVANAALGSYFLVQAMMERSAYTRSALLEA